MRRWWIPHDDTPGVLNGVGVSRNFPKIHPRRVDSGDFLDFFRKFFGASSRCARRLPLPSPARSHCSIGQREIRLIHSGDHDSTERPNPCAATVSEGSADGEERALAMGQSVDVDRVAVTKTLVRDAMSGSRRVVRDAPDTAKCLQFAVPPIQMVRDGYPIPRKLGKQMTKAELVDAVAQSAGVSKADAERTIGAFFELVVSSAKKGDKVAWPGFGSFSTSKRKARTGRNPQTGAPVQVPASLAMKFTASSTLKAELNPNRK